MYQSLYHTIEMGVEFLLLRVFLIYNIRNCMMGFLDENNYIYILRYIYIYIVASVYVKNGILGARLKNI